MDETKSEPWENAWHSLDTMGTPILGERAAFKAGWDACAAFYGGKRAAPITHIALYPSYTSIDAEDIYNAYPRHVGKQAAIAAITKAMKRGVGAGHLLDRTEAYARAVAKWPAEDRQYVPHCATWVNRGSYDDDPKEWQRGTPATQIRAAN